MLISLLLACAEAPVDAPLHVTGRVRTEAGDPVGGALVSVSVESEGERTRFSEDVKTRADGRWSVDVGGGRSWKHPGERVRVEAAATADGLKRDTNGVWAWPGDDVAVYTVLSSAPAEDAGGVRSGGGPDLQGGRR